MILAARRSSIPSRLEAFELLRWRIELIRGFGGPLIGDTGVVNVILFWTLTFPPTVFVFAVDMDL